MRDVSDAFTLTIVYSEEESAMLSHSLLIFSATLHVITYTLVAVYANLTEQHQDMCPFYVLIALAGLFHLLFALAQWSKNKHDSGNGPGHDAIAPIPDARRITYFDDRGEPFFTEWQTLPHTLPKEERKAA